MNLMTQPMKMIMRMKMILVKLRTKRLMRMRLTKKTMRKSLKVIKKWLVMMTTNGKTCLTLNKLRKYRMTLIFILFFSFLRRTFVIPAD